MKRRIAAVLLALCMCIGLLPATALAAGDGEYDFVRLMDRSDWKEATFLRAGEEETGTITLRRFFIYNEDDELLNSGAASGLATPDCYYADTKDVAPDEISRIVVCFTRTQGVKTTVVSAVFTKSDFVVSDTGGWGEAKHVELSLTDSGRQVPSGNAVRFYVELNDETTYTLYDTIYVQEGQQIGSQMPGNPPIGSYEFLGWQTAPDGGNAVDADTYVYSDMDVYASKGTADSGHAQEYRVMSATDKRANALSIEVADHYNEDHNTNYGVESFTITDIAVNGVDSNTNYLYSQNEWKNEGEYYYIYNVNRDPVEVVPEWHNDRVEIDEVQGITVYGQVNGQDYSQFIPVSELELIETLNNVVVEIRVREKLDSIAKELVTSAGEVPSGLNSSDYSYPDSGNVVTIPEGESVTLLYKITISGDTGAAYRIIDEGATVALGSITGTIDSTREAVVYVAKEFTAADEDGNLTNSATVVPGDSATLGADEGENSDDATVDANEGGNTDPAITGFTKTLVSSAENVPEGITDTYAFPNEDGKVIIPYGGEVTLLYKITVTGDADTDFTVTDKDAKLVAVQGVDIEEGADADTFTGTIPAGDGQTSITFYVSKTFKAEDLGTNNEGDQVLTNTATVVEDGGGEDDSIETEDETPAEEESYKVYTYVRFVNKDGTELTEDDKAEIQRIYGGTVNNDGYVAIGTFEIPMPDPAEKPYAPEQDGSGKGGPNVIVEHPDLWEAVQEDLTKGNFTWLDGVNGEKFDLENMNWIKLSTAHGAENFGVESKIACWHLDGQIQLYDSDITVVKTLTKVVRDEVEQTVSENMALEVGDELTWTITVTNKGNADATGLKLSDTLVAVAEDGTTSNRTATVTAVTDDAALDCFTVPAATTDGPSEVEFTATYTVTDDDKGLTLKNTATVTNGDAEEEGEGFTENEVANPAVDVTKALTSATRDGTAISELDNYKAQVGDVLSYTITVTNEGNTELTGVKVTDSMWVGTEYAIKVNGADNYAGADGFTIKDTIAVDGSVTITYTYTVQDSDVEAGEIKNTAGVYLDDGDTPDPGDEPDGKDDVTVEMDDYTIDIEPADIVIYTGGEGYSGVVNADGNVVGDMVTGNGLPQPGYHLVLSPAVTEWINAKEGEDADAAAAAERLDQILTFTYDVGDVERTWKLDYLGIHSYNEDGSAAAYVYSMTEVNNNPVSLRVFEDKDNSKTLTDGDKTITTDDIPMSETAASAEYLMTIDGGPLDQSKVQGKFTIGEDSITCGVTIGYGTLTVKSTTNKEYVTEIGTVDDNQISATGEGVTYYVNNSEVEVASNRVGLLVDSVSNEPTFDQTMENHAISKVSGISDPRAQSFYLDLVDTDNGHAVVRPSGDVTIYWPMPEGADPDGKFYIVHYTEMDRTDTGMQTAEPEVEEVFATQDDNHLTFTTDSFSPFVLVYEAKDTGTTDPIPVLIPIPIPATMIPTKPDCTSIPEAARSSRTRSANSPSTTTPTTRSPLAPATASPAGMTAAASTTGMTRMKRSVFPWVPRPSSPAGRRPPCPPC